MEVIDLNGDGQQELVSVVDKATQTSMAVMFTKRRVRSGSSARCS
ncbi:MAG: hypothetical protein ACLSG5_09710 [Oscillospiraceae bacterium]